MPPNNALHVVDPPASALTAYPISTFSYALVAAGSPRRSTLAQWLSYAIGPGQKYGPALDFAALPRMVVGAAQSTIRRFAAGH